MDSFASPSSPNVPKHGTGFSTSSLFNLIVIWAWAEHTSHWAKLNFKILYWARGLTNLHIFSPPTFPTANFLSAQTPEGRKKRKRKMSTNCFSFTPLILSNIPTQFRAKNNTTKFSAVSARLDNNSRTRQENSQVNLSVLRFTFGKKKISLFFL